MQLSTVYHSFIKFVNANCPSLFMHKYSRFWTIFTTLYLIFVHPKTPSVFSPQAGRLLCAPFQPEYSPIPRAFFRASADRNKTERIMKITAWLDSERNKREVEGRWARREATTRGDGGREGWAFSRLYEATLCCVNTLRRSSRGEGMRAALLYPLRLLQPRPPPLSFNHPLPRTTHPFTWMNIDRHPTWNSPAAR